jgi:hypothetical protein
MAGIGISPALLISDLGVPSRFLNMLRMFKVTSPMSVGSWILSAAGGAVTLSAANAWTSVLPGPARAAKPAAALLGLPLSTYTAALISNTSVPVWHEARGRLALVFGAGAAASAGGVAVAVTPPAHAAAARRLAIGAAVAELVATEVMERSIGGAAEPYHKGTAGRFARIAKGLAAVGAATIAAGAARARPAAVAGGALVAAGALAERWSVYKAGFQSVEDPKYVVEPQRERLDATAAPTGRPLPASR